MARRSRLAALAAACALFASAAAAEELTLLGTYTLPTGLKIEGVEFGGLSALDYDAREDVFYALSDDRAERGPARLYVLKLALSEKGVGGVDIVRRIDITDIAGEPYAPKSLDPEGLRLAPVDETRGAFYWAHERDLEGKPFAGVMEADGRTSAAFELPAYHMPTTNGGVRVNLGYESLTLTSAGDVVIATEEALAQDGPKATLTAGSHARVTVIDPLEGKPKAEYVYLTDPIAVRPTPGDAYATAGLVELLAKPGGGFYALERSYSQGQGTVVKIYSTEIGDATDVLGVESLEAMEIAPSPMTKTLLFSIQKGDAVDFVDNIEGMSFGPDIGGEASLVLISDNNFNPRGQATQILLFKIES